MFRRVTGRDKRDAKRVDKFNVSGQQRIYFTYTGANACIETLTHFFFFFDNGNPVENI
jgi:hypothetical protein